ncbi:MAG TPA: hypothetical protein VJ600_01255 [Holophagaceae bacterium]|nr:hypothetical protein [Holophagaceae bacterium]
MGCPECGSELLGRVADHYDEEVRRPGADPNELAPFAPPTEQHKIHLFVVLVLAWMSLLVPFFAPEGHLWRTTLPVWIATVAWLPFWLRSRRTDAVALAEYNARKFCQNCGWYER